MRNEKEIMNLLDLLQVGEEGTVLMDGLFCMAGGRWIKIQQAAIALALVVAQETDTQGGIGERALHPEG
jgi:hypothetical protein